jgi:tetratricopeptide (TPR) repeat protein
MKNFYLSIFSEIVGLIFLLSKNVYVGILFYLIFHAVAIFLLSTLLIIIIPKKYKKRESFYFLFFFGFFTFIAGFLFLFIISLYLLRNQKNIEYKPLESFSLDEIYTEDIEFSGRKFGEGGLVSILRSENVPKYLKEKAFLALTDLKSPFVFSVIKENLSNPIDEIRLLAFSLISKMEKELTQKIHQLQKKLNEKDLSINEKAEIYKELAQVYWEFVLYNIVDKEFENFMLKTAKDFAYKALEIKENPYVNFLLGRILFKERNIDEAIKYLLKAYNYSPLRQKVIPYLAEYYFYKRDFTSVKNIMKNLDLTIDLRLQFIKDFWVKNG